MPADTLSPLLQLLLQGTGNNNNSWGTNANNSVFTPLENAIAGSVIISTTGGTYTLTDDESRASTIIVQGALVSTLTIVVPARSKWWRFYVDTDGAVLAKTAAQVTPINLPTRRETKCFYDIANSIIRREDASKVGELFYHGGTTAPSGAMVCNGATPLRASFPDLFGSINTIWGAGNGTTTFTLPNGQDTNRFLRSSGGAIAVGTYQASQNKSHTHTGSGTTSTESADHTHTGSGTTSGQSVSHTHGFTAVLGPNGVTYAPNAGSSSGAAAAAGSNTGAASADHSHTYSFGTSGVSAFHTHTYSFTTSTGSADGAEARPESMVGLLCIRY